MKALRLNRYLHQMTQIAHREVFLADEAGRLATSDLKPEELTPIRERNSPGTDYSVAAVKG